MDAALVEREWRFVTQLLPPDLDDLARRTGALRRTRQIKDADTLLRLILLHVAAGLSLRQTTVRAKQANLATISDVALLKRLRASEPWLRALTEYMLSRSRYRPALLPQWKERQVRIVDATNVKESGATGTSWRVHYTLTLPALYCDFFEVTDATGGETFNRVPVHRGDVILGDRGYAHREGVAHVVHHGGDVVVRINHHNFPLLAQDGSPLSIIPTIRTLRDYEPGEWPVRFDSSFGPVTARLCAIRKSDAAATRAKALALKSARKKGKQIKPGTLETAEYILVLTTLTSQECSTEWTLELYRARWQIELAFKRLKSLLHAGHVPKYDEASARAWIQAKLLTALLIERLIEEARFFSPWGYSLPTPQP